MISHSTLVSHGTAVGNHCTSSYFKIKITLLVAPLLVDLCIFCIPIKYLNLSQCILFCKDFKFVNHFYLFQNSVISRFIGIDAVNALKNLKKAFEKFFIPLPTLLSDLEKVLKDVSASINISSTYLTGSNFNMKDVTDDVLKYDGIRYFELISDFFEVLGFLLFCLAIYFFIVPFFLWLY